MPHSGAWCCNCSPSGHFPSLAARHCSNLSQHVAARRHRLHRSTAAVSKPSASAKVDERVHVGQTPYGRGLLSSTDLRSGKCLLSVPFSQLLLLPDSVDPSFEKIQQRFMLDHGELPAELLRFIQGDLQTECLPFLESLHWQVGQDGLADGLV